MCTITIQLHLFHKEDMYTKTTFGIRDYNIRELDDDKIESIMDGMLRGRVEATQQQEPLASKRSLIQGWPRSCHKDVIDLANNFG